MDTQLGLTEQELLAVVGRKELTIVVLNGEIARLKQEILGLQASLQMALQKASS